MEVAYEIRLMRPACVLLVALAFATPLAAKDAPPLVAHLCKGTLIDQRTIGISLGDCDLNDLGAGDLDQIAAVRGQPHGVSDYRKKECRVCGYVRPTNRKPDERGEGFLLVEPMAVTSGPGRFDCIWRGD
jgi:hypothetical protein